MSQMMLSDLLPATWDTLYMVLVASTIASLLGLPLGVLLFTTRKNGLIEHPLLYRTLAVVVNAFRSLPFIILLVAIIPFTRWIVGTSIGTTAAIVPLTVGAIPFVARIVENAISEVPDGLIEAGLSLGASPFQIVKSVLIPEAAAGIIRGIIVVVIALVGYSAMAGVVGGGGLGDLAIRYGYQRFNTTVMLETVIILIVMVQCIQYLGDKLTEKFEGKQRARRTAP